MYCGGKTPHTESVAAQLGSVSEIAYLCFGVATTGLVYGPKLIRIGDPERKERIFGQNRKKIGRKTHVF